MNTNRTVHNELYISVDIESDGPIPGKFSMVSFGMSAAVLRNSQGEYVDMDVDAPENQFYAELKPISDEFIPEALAVSGLNRDDLLANGRDVVEAMTAACEWVVEVAARNNARPVFAAYPLGFDWMFWYWYAVAYSTVPCPFGHSAHIDMKTLYAQKAGVALRDSTKSRMPSFIKSNRKHTHNGLDDAIEQGQMMGKILRWDGTR